MSIHPNRDGVQCTCGYTVVATHHKETCPMFSKQTAAVEDYERAYASTSGAYRTKTGEVKYIADSRVDRFIRAGRDLGARVQLDRQEVRVEWTRYVDEIDGLLSGSHIVAVVEIGHLVLSPEEHAKNVVEHLRKRANEMARERKLL